MLQHSKIVKIKVGDQDGENTLTVDLDDLGIPTDLQGNINDAIIIAKETSAGVGKVEDDKVVVSGGNLVFTEGSTGWADNDTFFVMLLFGLDEVTGTLSTV